MSEMLFSEPQPPTEDSGKPLGQLVAQYWDLFKHYFWIMILTSALTGMAAYFWTKRQPKIYQAQSKIIFHAGNKDLFGRDIARVDLMDPGARWQFSQFWNTQKEILRSKNFAKMVAKRANLLEYKDFVASKNAKGEPYTQDQRLDRAAKRLQRLVTIRLQRDSRVAIVSARVHDKKLAQYLATQYAKVYVVYTKEYQSGGLNQMISWFDNYVAGKRKELDDSHKKLLEFKKNKGILALSYESRQNLSASNMQTINEQLIKINNKLASEESLLLTIKQMSKSKEDMRTLVELVPEAPTLREAIGREALLKEKYAQLRGRGYQDDWREVKAVREELRVVQQNINQDIQRIQSGVKNRTAALRRERSRLKRELAKFKKEVFNLDGLGLEYTRLKDNTKNLQDLYNAVLKRSEELDINSMYESNNIEVLEIASLPKGPVSPNMPLNLALGVLIGLAFGAGIIILIDLMDDTVKREEHVLRYTDRPILGLLPKINSSLFKNLSNVPGNASDIVTAIAPKSSFAEGIKALRTNIMFMTPNEPPRLLTVTSPGPGEGKTMISSNISIAMAQSGLKTVIIDADLRRPRVHKAFDLENNHGLSSILADGMDLDDAVQKTNVENLDILTSGPIPPNPSELLHTEDFKALCKALGKKYDRVIFDSPPMGAVSDPIILSHMVDGTLLVLMFGKTRRELLRRSIEQLVTVGAPFLGCVLNNIDVGRGGYYGYSYYRYNYDDAGEAKS